MTLAIGVALALAVSAIAYRLRALDASGAIAAFIVGAITFGTLGWNGAAVLFAFFLPSTALSRIGRARKRALVDIEKQGARDAWQVLANGGVAALCALLGMRLGAPFFAAFAGAFAAASADTWGTEIGTLARGKPRSILTFAALEPGLSGGITVQGTLAQACGAVVVAIVASATHLASPLVVAVAGFAGATVDSLLGASAQALRWCPSCDRGCETDPHHCGTATVLRRGYAWLENDAVNLAATASGALCALLLSVFLV